jgi:Na+/proline symporter
MPKISTDIILFATFLAINLIIGLLAGRRVKTIRDYSIGNKDFSTATITSTIVATWIGGGFMFYAMKNIYTSGLQFIIVMLGGRLCLLFTGQVLAVRMGEFLNNISVAEAMGNLYGRVVRLITAVSGILGVIGYIAVQFQVIAKMLTLLLGFQGPWVTITAASIVIIYSAFGGIRSVVITDLLQFIVFSIFIPILALIVWNHLKNPTSVSDILATNPIFSFKETIGWNPKFLKAVSLMLYFVIPGIEPSIFQRIAMAKDLKQVKDSFTYAAGITFLMVLSVAWIAILLLADNPGLDPNNLVNYIIMKYAYPGLKGLIAVGITAMAMSTADSDLNASAVLVVNDIIKPLKARWKESIIIARMLSIVLGIAALILALGTTDLLDLLLLSASFYMPIISVPLLLAIFGFRSSTRAVLIGMSAGFITVLFWDKLLGHTGINNIIPAILANVAFFMGSHYILREKGGWVGIKVKEPLIAARQSRRDAWINFANNIKETKIYNYLQQNLPAYEVVYTFFAIYVIGATYVSFYTIPDEIVANYKKLYDFASHSVLIATAGFLTYPAWPLTFKGKRFITFAWPAGIFYILFVVGTMLVIMSGFHEVQVMVFMLNLIMAAFLLSWPLMLILSTLGMFVGSLLFYLYYGPIHFTGAADSGQFRVMYVVLLLGSFLIALFRFKQQKQALQNKNTYLVTLYEERNNELAEILGYREQILKELSEDEKALFDHTTAAYLQQIIYRMTDYIRLEVTKINLDELLLEVKQILKLKELDPIPQLITEKNTKEEAINGDPAKIKQLLANGILYVHKHNPTNQPIMVIIEDARLGHRVDYIKDYTRQLAALKFTITIEKVAPAKKNIYMLDQLPLMSQHTRKRKLVENARIIHAHYGYAELDKEHTQVYVLPLNVREVRGKVMELLRAPNIVSPEELKHPLAIQLEKELLDKIKGTKIDNKVIANALDTIKKYHAGVKRKSGEPFFTHPIAVTLILLEYCKDQDAVVAALLHDTVEDTSLSLIQIKAMFGDQVAFIVNKVTNLEDKLRRVNLEDHENVYRLMENEDDRAAFVKLADRLHNMRTISGHSSLAKQKHIANETLNFFVPLAKNLGLAAVAEELRTLSLEVLAKK